MTSKSPSSKISVVIIEENEAVISDIVNGLKNDDGIEILKILRTIPEAREYLDTVTVMPDILLVSMDMARFAASYNLQHMRVIKKRIAETNVILMGERCIEENFVDIVKEGISAFILKKEISEFIDKCIHAVSSGEVWLKANVVRRIFDEYISHHEASGHIIKAPTDIDYQKLEKLTKRELEVLDLLSQSFTNEEIAEKIYISSDTVKTHIRNLFEKLEARNRVEATLIYIGATRNI